LDKKKKKKRKYKKAKTEKMRPKINNDLSIIKENVTEESKIDTEGNE
jgi:hypothetical protein